MKTVTIYTKVNCPYCDRAKALLKLKNIEFEEINLNNKPEIREWLKNQGHRTVPQLYIGDQLLVEGGFQGLAALTDQELFERVGHHANSN